VKPHIHQKRRVINPPYWLKFALKGGEKGEKARLGISLEQVRLGEKVLYAAGKDERRPPAARGNRAHYPRGEMVIEEYAALDAVVEQSFIVTRLPADVGAQQAAPLPLVIELALQTDLKPVVRAQQAAPLPTDAEGIVFLDGNDQEVLAYGRATVRDAAGRETTARPALEGTRLSLTVPGEWLAGATYPLLVDPLIGDPILVSGGPSFSGAPAVAYNPDDDEWLVVWKDNGNGNWDIFGQRVSAGGELLGNNFAVSSLPDDETLPSLAWDGNSGRYLVGWQGWGLGQRVWADGTLDGGPIGPSASANSPDHAYGHVSGIILGVGEIYGDVYAQRYAIPVARFTAEPLSGTAPLAVTFTNQ